jgi:threonine synthase
MKKLLLVLVAVILLSAKGWGQNLNIECSTDFVHQKLMQTDTAYRAHIISQEQQIQYIIQNQVLQEGSRAVYTIPVVVHVIHLGEAIGTGTNISTTIIQQVIDGANERFRNLIGNGTTDVEIQFCLASRDPNGNSTTGINRVDGSSVTNYSSGGIANSSSCTLSANEITIKNLSRWPNTDYYNIWVVKSVCNGEWGGYAYYPGASSTVDGAVVVFNQFKYNDVSAAHELGHGFNLSHTFSGDNGNTTCPSNNNCAVDGDKCCDTPPHKQDDCGGTNPCTSSGVWDNSRYNIMAYCHYGWPNMTSYGRFTADQKSRIQATLLVSPRSALLNSLGCDPPVVPCTTCPTNDFSFTPTTTWQTHNSSIAANGCKMYRFSVTSGNDYTFKTGCGDGATAAFDTYLELLNSGCTQIAYNDDDCENTRSAITWTATYNGYVYLKVRGYGSTDYGTYTLAYRYTNCAPPTSVTVTGGGTFCNAATLTASGGSGGTIYWQGTTSGGTSTSNSTNPQTVTSSGTYYFRAYNSCGWGTQGSATVTINTSPTVVTVTGGGTFCNAATLTASGGSGGTIYWQGTTSGGTSTSNSTNPQTVTSSGTYYFRAYNSCGWGTQGSATVTINTSPTVVTVTGGGTFCNAATLTASGGSGGTIYWQGTTSGGTSTSNSTNPQTVTSSGTYYFRAYNSCGWGTQGSATVTINTSPTVVTVTGGGTFCNAATLTASGGSGGTIYWQGTTSGGTSTSNSTNPQTVTSSGTYYFRAYNSCGWGTQGSATVTINTSPTVVTVTGGGTFCNAATLTASGGSGGTIYWQGTTSGGTSTSNSTNPQTVTSSGTYYFRAYNSCGWGTQGSATVTINTAPAQPGTIATNNSSPCNGAQVTYSISAIPGAATYNWTVPPGWIINGGNGTTSLLVTVINTGGNVSVTSGNTCGISSPQSLSVTLGTSPAQPGTIATNNSSPCNGAQVTYSISAIPGAATYNWTVPPGWIINGGNGTTSLLVTVINTGGNVSVTSGNTCGISSPQSLSVTLGTVPAQPGTIATNNSSPCNGAQVTYSISAIPGAATYNWTVPPGWIINGGNGTTSLLVTVINTGGNVSVTSGNTCGISSPQSLSVTLGTSPAQPGTIATNNSSPCNGAQVTYSISAIPGAATYNWTVPPGWIINGGNGTTSLLVTVINTGGNVSVTSGNTCGISSPQSLSVTLGTSPAQPGTIATNNSSPCNGTEVTYSISSVSGATSYTWSYSGGGTPSGTGTSVTFTPTGSGTLTVTANNSCGSSSQQVLSVLVDDVPETPVLNAPSVISSSQIDLSWSAVSGNPTNYNVYYDATDCTPSILFSSPAGTVESVIGLDANTTYYFGVTAENTCGESGFACLSATTYLETSVIGVSSNDFSLVPNPNNGQFELVIPEFGEQTDYQILDNLGQLIKAGKITSERTIIDMLPIAEGVHMLQLLKGNEILDAQRVVFMK